MTPLPPRDFHFFPILNRPVDPPPLVLTSTTTWSYCGPLLPLPVAESASDSDLAVFSNTLPESFHTWAHHTFASPSPATNSHPLLTHLLPLLQSTHTFLRTHNTTHYWLTIRATQPTSAFNNPRWHTDDAFFLDPRQSEHARNQWKLCATLQGPGTLFAADGGGQGHVCSTMRCAACGRTSEVVREMVGKELEGREVVQVGNGEMVFFRLGGREGAVHSEPRMDGKGDGGGGGDRVFVNVVPGTEEELRGLMGRWGMEFPRSWSLGVPVV
ncbi:uncharacterized protein C8A04DRAFT_12352 [Dichotomopilus funicola]|uniref:Uncharacterized protein n=1 Tax=Dichotomopilus funicola TaxID=1934379 RepID=A0AAN6V243_9PEZI|nr:hypothetical protein C8A04DRAFT_12352 [Dichotomopilus funicola]